MSEDYEYWDKDDEEFDSDDEVAITPTVDSEVIFEEETEDKDYEKEIKEKVTAPIMYEYEKSNVIYKRQMQLDRGKESTMEDKVLKEKITSSYDIANLEFDNGMLPTYYIIRKLDKGYYEKWTHSDFLFFPK